MWRVGLVGLLAARIAAAECEIAVRPPVSVAVVGTTATLSLDGRTRVIEAKTCAELAKSVAVVVDMILAVPRDPAPAPTEAPATTEDATTEPVADAPAPKPERPLDPVTRATVDADMAEVTDGGEAAGLANVEHAVVAVLGTSTSLGEALAVGMRWRWDTVSVTTELAGELPGGVAMGANVSILRASAAFLPCKHVGPVALCGIVRAGLDHGSGVGLMNARSATEVRADLGARLAWEQPVTDHVALQLRGEFDVATTSSQFDVDQLAVWRSSRFAGLAGAGVVVRFP